MEYQEEIHGDKKFVGNVEILGSLNSKDISVLRNKINQSRSESQTVKASFTKFYETIITDGIADVAEKRVLLQKWNEIEAEYPIIRQRALDRGISDLDEQMVDYANAYTALDTYLFGATGILDDMTVETTIVPAEMDLAFSTYYTERETVLSLTFTKSEENTVDEALESTPRFRGSFLYVDDAGADTYYSTAVPGDWVVLKSGTALLCGIYQWSGTSWIKKTGSGITEEMISTTALSVLAAVDEGYGASTDYLSLSSTALEIIIARRIFAKEITMLADGWIKTANYAETDGIPDSGFMLDVKNGLIKAVGAILLNGFFAGSIESGPLVLNKDPPATASFTISGSIAAFVIDIFNSTGLPGGVFNCSGSYNSTTLGRIEFTINKTVHNYSQEQWIYDWAPMFGTPWWIVHTWSRAADYYTLTIKLYDTNGDQLCNYSDTYEAESTWSITSTRSEQALYAGGPTSAPSPLTVSASGGTVNFGSTGTLSFVAGAYTYKLINLPSGYSSAFPIGTVYMDSNRFLKVAP